MEGTTIHHDHDTDFICSRIIHALAAATDTDPLEMEPPLYYVVDVEALGRLLESDAPVTVTFEYDGHEVLIDGDGVISVDGTVYES